MPYPIAAVHSIVESCVYHGMQSRSSRRDLFCSKRPTQALCVRASVATPPISPGWRSPPVDIALEIALLYVWTISTPLPCSGRWCRKRYLVRSALRHRPNDTELIFGWSPSSSIFKPGTLRLTGQRSGAHLTLSLFLSSVLKQYEACVHRESPLVRLPHGQTDVPT